MSIQVTCEKCKLELEWVGALIFSPPTDNYFDKVNKYHICTRCWIKLERWMRSYMKNWKPKDGKKYWFLSRDINWPKLIIVDRDVWDKEICFGDYSNAFPTKHSADLALRKIQRILGVK